MTLDAVQVLFITFLHCMYVLVWAWRRLCVCTDLVLYSPPGGTIAPNVKMPLSITDEHKTFKTVVYYKTT